MTKNNLLGLLKMNKVAFVEDVLDFCHACAGVRLTPDAAVSVSSAVPRGRWRRRRVTRDAARPPLTDAANQAANHVNYARREVISS